MLIFIVLLVTMVIFKHNTQYKRLLAAMKTGSSSARKAAADVWNHRRLRIPSSRFPGGFGHVRGTASRSGKLWKWPSATASDQAAQEDGAREGIFREEKLAELPGTIAIGHVRYPTKGSATQFNSQPHLLETLFGPSHALASNGDIVNYCEVRRKLEAKACISTAITTVNCCCATSPGRFKVTGRGSPKLSGC
jgi:hypothetical protein